MRAWGRGALPINKMAEWLSWLSQLGGTQICLARGSVSWGSKDSAAGELQLWCHEGGNHHYLYASKTAGVDILVCKVIDVFTLHFQKCSDKIKTLLTKKSKFYFVRYWKQASRDLTYFWVIHHMATLLGSSNVNIPVKMMAHHQHVQVLINSILSEWPSGVGWWWNYVGFRANLNDIRGMASTCSLRVICVDCSALKICKR